MNNYQAHLPLFNWFEIVQLQKWHSAGSKPRENIGPSLWCLPPFLRTCTHRLAEKIIDKWDDTWGFESGVTVMNNLDHGVVTQSDLLKLVQVRRSQIVAASQRVSSARLRSHFLHICCFWAFCCKNVDLSNHCQLLLSDEWKLWELYRGRDRTKSAANFLPSAQQTHGCNYERKH